MSVETPTYPRVARDDEDGDNNFWDNLKDQMLEPHKYVMTDVSKRTLGGAGTYGAFADSYQSAYQVPAREQNVRPNATFVGPDLYHG